jgi:hypothetical protein
VGNLAGIVIKAHVYCSFSDFAEIRPFIVLKSDKRSGGTW